MKGVQHNTKKDVFTDWVNQVVTPKIQSVYWPQITYEWSSCKPIHIVFEKNQQSFKWPWDSPVNLRWPVTNIDFTKVPPIMASGELWDYNNWYKAALGCSLSREAREVPISFWNWRLQTWPQGNATCDIDLLFQRNDKWIGVEATEIWYVKEDESNYNEDCYQHISNLIHKRKAFNHKALLAQSIFMDSLGGEHYFLLHKIDKNRGVLVDDRVIVIPLNLETLRILQQHTSDRNEVKKYLEPYIQFIPLRDFFVL
tara:strand:- start:130 stop:894 length:765 start_codon:yes stop_codon:yes gene_type:complete